MVLVGDLAVVEPLGVQTEAVVEEQIDSIVGGREEDKGLVVAVEAQKVLVDRVGSYLVALVLLMPS